MAYTGISVPYTTAAAISDSLLTPSYLNTVTNNTATTTTLSRLQQLRQKLEGSTTTTTTGLSSSSLSNVNTLYNTSTKNTHSHSSPSSSSSSSLSPYRNMSYSSTVPLSSSSYAAAYTILPSNNTGSSTKKNNDTSLPIVKPSYTFDELVSQALTASNTNNIEQLLALRRPTVVLSSSSSSSSSSTTNTTVPNYLNPSNPMKNINSPLINTNISSTESKSTAAMVDHQVLALQEQLSTALETLNLAVQVNNQLQNQLDRVPPSSKQSTTQNSRMNEKQKSSNNSNSSTAKPLLPLHKTVDLFMHPSSTTSTVSTTTTVNDQSREPHGITTVTTNHVPTTITASDPSTRGRSPSKVSFSPYKERKKTDNNGGNNNHKSIEGYSSVSYPLGRSGFGSSSPTGRLSSATINRTNLATGSPHATSGTTNATVLYPNSNTDQSPVTASGKRISAVTAARIAAREKDNHPNKDDHSHIPTDDHSSSMTDEAPLENFQPTSQVPQPSSNSATAESAPITQPTEQTSSYVPLRPLSNIAPSTRDNGLHNFGIMTSPLPNTYHPRSSSLSSSEAAPGVSKTSIIHNYNPYNNDGPNISSSSASSLLPSYHSKLPQASFPTGLGNMQGIPKDIDIPVSPNDTNVLRRKALTDRVSSTIRANIDNEFGISFGVLPLPIPTANNTFVPGTTTKNSNLLWDMDNTTNDSNTATTVTTIPSTRLIPPFGTTTEDIIQKTRLYSNNDLPYSGSQRFPSSSSVAGLSIPAIKHSLGLPVSYASNNYILEPVLRPDEEQQILQLNKKYEKSFSPNSKISSISLSSNSRAISPSRYLLKQQNVLPSYTERSAQIRTAILEATSPEKLSRKIEELQQHTHLSYTATHTQSLSKRNTSVPSPNPTVSASLDNPLDSDHVRSYLRYSLHDIHPPHIPPSRNVAPSVHTGPSNTNSIHATVMYHEPSESVLEEENEEAATNSDNSPLPPSATVPPTKTLPITVVPVPPKNPHTRRVSPGKFLTTTAAIGRLTEVEKQSLRAERDAERDARSLAALAALTQRAYDIPLLDNKRVTNSVKSATVSGTKNTTKESTERKPSSSKSKETTKTITAKTRSSTFTVPSSSSTANHSTIITTTTNTNTSNENHGKLRNQRKASASPHRIFDAAGMLKTLRSLEDDDFDHHRLPQNHRVPDNTYAYPSNTVSRTASIDHSDYNAVPSSSSSSTTTVSSYVYGNDEDDDDINNNDNNNDNGEFYNRISQQMNNNNLYYPPVIENDNNYIPPPPPDDPPEYSYESNPQTKPSKGMMVRFSDRSLAPSTIMDRATIAFLGSNSSFLPDLSSASPSVHRRVSIGGQSMDSTQLTAQLDKVLARIKYENDEYFE